MHVEICSQCGAPCRKDESQCSYCGAGFISCTLATLASTPTALVREWLGRYQTGGNGSPDANLMFAQGIVYLRLGVFDLCRNTLLKSIEASPDFADAYYYYGIALIEKRSLRGLTLSAAKEIEKYLSAAIEIDAKAHYLLLLAVFKHEFYLGNGLLLRAPRPDQLLARAQQGPWDAAELQVLGQYVPGHQFLEYMR